MKTAGRSRLTTPPFVTLYVAAAVAVALSFARGQFGAAWWFPIATGLTAAAAIISLFGVFANASFDVSQRARRRWALAFFLASAALPFAPLLLLKAKSLLLVLAMVAISATYLFAAMGTMFCWPGFRGQLRQDGCANCGGDLYETDTACRNCGQPAELDRED